MGESPELSSDRRPGRPSRGRQGGQGLRRAFLFSDVADSTPLWEQYPEAMAEAMARHDRIVTQAVETAGGRVVDRTGDGMDAAFPEVSQAATAAAEAQRALMRSSWGEVGTLRVRMAIDVGEAELRGERYYGPVLNRLGRILAAAHGGQVLLSEDAHHALPASAGFETRALGEYRFKGVGRPQQVYQLVVEGAPAEFPPLRMSGRPRSVSSGTDTEPGSIRGYQILDRLGEGDFGLVYRAFQASIGREVALKVIRSEYANRPAFIRSFESEAQLVARLEHPHIVALYDFWRDPDGAYLVMPYLHGGSLADALRRGPWNPDPALRLLEQVGSALSYAHRRGIVHRDLKPANILLDEDENAYVADFGVARAIGGRDRGMPASSPGYLPPEVAQGDSAGPRSDIFSLGVLVFELLTGSPAEGGLRGPAEIRPDLPGELDEIVRRATADDPSDRYERVEDTMEAIRRALLADRVAETATRPAVAEVRNPYKGLEAFTEADARDFHGREDLVDEILTEIASRRLVSVVGASGSGKSSVVRAGVVPALRSGEVPGEWLVADMFPGSYPFEELEAALLRVAVEDPGGLVEELRRDEHGLLRVSKRILPPDQSELMLVIDQFEELFSLVEDEETRRSFLDSLTALVTDERGRVRVLLTMRADFFDRPLEYPAFGELLRDGLVPVTAPSEEGLERAITRPARNVGLELEPALVPEIIADVQGQPGRLPLLQYALTELFERRDDGLLTVEAYRETGGVAGALARRAEAVYGELSDPVRRAARQVFLRLVSLGEGAEDTRRRVPRAELASLPGLQEEVEDVLETFGAHRLLAFDRDASSREPTVEIAHDALLRHSERLRRWIDEARDDVRRHRRLQAAVAQWYESGEDEAYLLPPERIAPTDEWVESSRIALSDEERRFLELSRERKEEQEAAEARRQAHERALERRAVNRLRVAVAVLVLGVIAAIGLSVYALGQRNRAEAEQAVAERQRLEAEEQRAVAERQERIATARGLASAAVAQLSDDPERSILLALEAIATTRDTDGTVLPEAERALRRALRASHIERRLPSGSAVSVAPDGRIAILGVEGTLTIWDPNTRERLLELPGQSSVPVQPGPSAPEFFLGRTDDVDFSPDGSEIVVPDADLRGAVRDASTGEVVVELEDRLTRPAFSPDGSLVAAVLVQEAQERFDAGRTVGIWDATTGELVRRLEGHSENVQAYAFSPDGESLVSVSRGSTWWWSLDTGEPRWSVEAGEENPLVLSVAFHPDGRRIALGSQEGPVLLRDADDGALAGTLAGHPSPVRAVAFSPDGERLLTAGTRGARVWEMSTGREIFTLQGHTAVVRDAVFAAGGDRVVTTSEDGTTRIWNVAVEGGFEYAALPLELPPPAALRTAFVSDDRLPVTGAGGTVHVWNVAEKREELVFRAEDAVHLVTSAGQRIVTASAIGFGSDSPSPSYDQVDLWDAATGEHLGTVATYEATNWDLTLSPDGSTVASAGAHDILRAVDVDTGRELFRYVHEGGAVYRVAFAPDGDRLVVGAQDAGLVLDATTGEVLHELAEVERSVFDVAFLDERRAVTGELGGVFRLWDLETGDQLRVMGREGGAGILAIRDDLMAIGAAESLVVRDLETGEARFETTYTRPVAQVVISPDGRYLAAVLRGSWVHIHVLGIEDLIDLAHQRLTRSLTDEECREFLQTEGCPER